MDRSISGMVASHQLPALTGLRAVFVGLVVLYHTGLGLPAGLGVTGFFVLSGFLITWLLLKELDSSGDISLRDFYRRRALRIFPAYYAFLAVSIGTDLLLGDDRIRPAILPGVFYLINYYNAFNGHPAISIAHAWSLAVEEQFYLLWPIVLLLVARKKRAALPWVLGGCIVAVMAWRSFAYEVLGWSAAYAYNAFECRFDSLAVGCLLAATVKQWGPAIDKTRAWFPLLIVPLLFVVDLPAVRFNAGFTLSSVLLGVFMLQVMRLHQHRLWSWVESKPVKYVGTISYGIYLYHIYGLAVGQKLLGDSAVGWRVLGVACTLIAAALSYHLYESWFLRLKDRAALVTPTLVPSGTPR